ncbi:MAG: hypothetical protein J5870_00885, partial [Clostridia bacterium]|nr:hypothetical protein [Clostridia bacterium]
MKGKLKKLTAVILSIALLGSAGLFTGLTAFADIPEGGYTIGVEETIDIEVAGNDDKYGSLTFIKFVPQ